MASATHPARARAYKGTDGGDFLKQETSLGKSGGVKEERVEKTLSLSLSLSLSRECFFVKLEKKPTLETAPLREREREREYVGTIDRCTKSFRDYVYESTTEG